MKRRKKYAGLRKGMFMVVTEPDEQGFCECVCDCGRHKRVHTDRLSTGMASSCGCKRTNHCLFGRNGTNMALVKKVAEGKIDPRNKTGVTGVYRIERTGKYLAYIGYRGQLIRLGVYSDIEDAAKARKDAEQKYFAQFIDLVNGGDEVC